MLGSVLPFSPELADRVSAYCEKHSEDDVVETTRAVDDLDEPNAGTQASLIVGLARLMIEVEEPPVLEVGTFTGFSALAWYEGTRATQAEIITLDVRGEVLAFTRSKFQEMGVDDRIQILEGPAAASLANGDPTRGGVVGQFDLVFLDADKHNYQNYLDTILDRQLLSPKGIILVDNVFARGLTMGPEFNPFMEGFRRPFWEKSAETLRELNKSFLNDERIDCVLLPMFDGITQIKWRAAWLEKAARK
ncbi:MAG: hypothetical protein Q9191_007181 [Dirinaria sp. TL-2023a]